MYVCVCVCVYLYIYIYMYMYMYMYIYIYIYIYCILQQYKEQHIIFTRFSPTLINFSFFPNKSFFFSLILGFVKLLSMSTHDFSRVNFASELSTNLVYKSIFVIDNNYRFIRLLFFYSVKLSIFSRLCLKHKRVMSRSTHTEM